MPTNKIAWGDLVDVTTGNWIRRYGDVAYMWHTTPEQRIPDFESMWESQWKVMEDPFDLVAELTLNRYELVVTPFEEMEDFDTVAPTLGPTRGYFPSMLVDDFSYAHFQDLNVATDKDMYRELNRLRVWCEGEGKQAERGPDGLALCFTCLERVKVKRHLIQKHNRWDETPAEYQRRTNAILEVQSGRTRPSRLS